MADEIEGLRARHRAAARGSAASAEAAGVLGRRLAARYFREGAAPADGDEAIELLDESLSVSHDDVTVTHVALGTLLFFRAMPIKPGADPKGEQAMAITMALMNGELNTPERLADRDRARSHLEWIVAHEPADADVRKAAEALLIGLELLGPADLGRMMTLMGRLGSVAPAIGADMGSLAGMLVAVAEYAPPERLGPAMQDVLRQLPAGHRLRPMILAEAGALLAQAGPEAAAPFFGDLPKALADTLAELPGDRPGDRPGDLPDRGATRRRLAGLLVSAAAHTSDREGAGQAVETARQLVREDGLPHDRFLLGMALTLRGRLSGETDDLRDAAAELAVALDGMPQDDSLRPMAFGMLGALLQDRHLAQGVLADAQAGQALLARAEATGGDRRIIELAALMSRTVLAVRRRDRAGLDEVITSLEAGLAELDESYPWRSRLDAGLGLALVARNGPGDLRQGLERLRRADTDLLVEASGRPVLRAAGALAELLDGVPGDPESVARILAAIDAAAADVAATDHDRSALALVGAQVALAAGDAAEAVGRFGAVCSGPITARPGHPLAATAWSGLSSAHELAGNAAEAVDCGLAALRAYGDDVLLQSGAEHALEAARQTAGFSARVAGQAFAAELPEKALEAVELGRGIVLHSAMTGPAVPDMLRAAGRDDLAEAWSAEPAEPVTAIDAVVAPPSDLRPRVLAALHTAGAEPLSAAPDREEIGRVVRDAGADLIVYLLPGRLLTVTADGRLDHVEVPELRADAPEVTAVRPSDAPRVWRRSLGELCDWAGTTLLARMRALGATRVVLVPVGALGLVPWHAARLGGRYACEDLTLSYAVSARQLRAVLRRPATRSGDVVLVADASGSLAHAPAEIAALRAGPYRQAIAYGPVPDAAGPGTPDEVLAALAADPAVLHLACHAVAGPSPEESHVVLAGSDLHVARLLEASAGRAATAPGGLVVLSACETDLTVSDFDEALTLSTAFSAAGATGVVGSRWRVADKATAALMGAFHHYRTAEARPDPEALRAAQIWMADPARAPLPGVHRPAGDWSDPVFWAAFTHHGRFRPPPAADALIAVDEVLDLLDEAVAWQLPAQRWDHVEAIVGRILAALLALDAGELRDALVDLELSGPVRAGRIGAATPIPAPARLLELVAAARKARRR